MTNLILLEDEPILCSELADFLAERGHQVDVADSIDAFRRQYRPGKYSIALVDLGLPDGEGLDLIAWLRGQGESLGVIVLTARTGTRNKTEGLLQGADHYLSKPFDFEELAATVTALSRRLQPDEERQRWVLDTLRCALIPPGKPPIALTAQSYIVFRTIAAGEGLPVDRRRIVEALGENYLDYDQRRLDTQMYQLRKTVSRPAAWSSRCAPRAGGGIRSLKSWTCAAESLVLRFPQFWGLRVTYDGRCTSLRRMLARCRPSKCFKTAFRTISFFLMFMQSSSQLQQGLPTTNAQPASMRIGRHAASRVKPCPAWPRTVSRLQSRPAPLIANRPAALCKSV